MDKVTDETVYCQRCKGRMIREVYYSRSEPNSFMGWRCTRCGDIVDPTILRHRVYGPSRKEKR